MMPVFGEREGGKIMKHVCGVKEGGEITMLAYGVREDGRILIIRGCGANVVGVKIRADFGASGTEQGRRTISGPGRTATE